VTITLKEVGTSATSSNDNSSLTIEYLIVDDAGAVVTKAQAFGALPALGATLTQEGETLSVQSRSVEAVQDSTGRLWRGTIAYQANSSTTSFVALDMNSSLTIVDLWRVSASAPANLNAPSESDIGGTAVDSRGTPVSVPIPVQELTVTNYRSDNNATAIRNALGKRNQSAWLGAAAGYVLFTGATARRVSSTRYEVTYKFAFDSLAHLRQVCGKDADGDPLLGTLNADGHGNASKVYWRQPFPAVTEFSSMGIVVA
jgi:hypothetical protein